MENIEIYNYDLDKARSLGISAYYHWIRLLHGQDDHDYILQTDYLQDELRICATLRNAPQPATILSCQIQLTYSSLTCYLGNVYGLRKVQTPAAIIESMQLHGIIHTAGGAA